jgi:uncharacterized glyoxalase superfamily protein PhnB
MVSQCGKPVSGLIAPLLLFVKPVEWTARDVILSTISGITLSHNVDGPAAVDEAVSAMVTAGAVVLKQPTNAAFGGYHGHVQDPNGVIWEIAHNPGWRMDDTGRVFLE